jgi:hypothetical protein
LTLLRVSPWAILLLLLRKVNRNWQAWLVLIPVVMMCALGLVVGRAIPEPEIGTWLGQIISSGALCLSALWLLADVLPSRNRMTSFLLSAVVIVTVAVTVPLFDNCLRFSQEKLVPALMVAPALLVLLLGMAVTSWMCRKRYDPWRFVLWLPLVLVGLSFGAFGIVAAFNSFRGYHQLTPVLVVPAFTLALALYAFVVPFMLLTFTTPLYRSRFQALFRLSETQRSFSDVEPQVAPEPTLT